MIYLTSTRFNNETWQQNRVFREKNKMEGCIYGVPKRLSEEIILTHLNPELAEPQAIESVGSLSKYGSVRNLIEDSRVSMQELYEEKIMSYLCQGISRILDRCLNKDELSDIPEWHEILGTNVS